jgi:hypothetical protein
MIPVQLKDSAGGTFGVDRVGNRLSVNVKPYYDLIAEGLVSEHSFISKFGHDSAGDTSNHIEVWDGSIAYPYPASAETLYLSSTSEADDQTYEIQGLDENWNPQTVEVTAAGPTGQDSVPLGGSWIRVFRIKNIGTTDNAGTIHVSTDSDTSDTGGAPATPATQSRAQVSVGFNQTLMAIWAVPNNKTAYLTNLYASAAQASPGATQLRCEVALWVRPFGGVFQIKKLFSLQSGATTQLKYDFPLEIAAKSDVRITSLSSAAADVSAGFDAWYEDI